MSEGQGTKKEFSLRMGLLYVVLRHENCCQFLRPNSVRNGDFGRFLTIVFITIISLVGLFQTCQPSTLHHRAAFAGPACGGFKTGHGALELGKT